MACRFAARQQPARIGVKVAELERTSIVSWAGRRGRPVSRRARAVGQFWALRHALRRIASAQCLGLNGLASVIGI